MKKLFHNFFRSLHPGKIKLPLAIALAFLILLPFIPSSGKVFWSRFLTQGRSIFDTTGSWTQIYKCPITINGARASLSVYGCDDSLQSVTAKLKQSFSLNNKKNYLLESEEPRGKPRGIFTESSEAKNAIPPCGKPQGFLAKEDENSAQFSSADRNQISRLLMLRMPGKDQSVIFELIQPLGEISKPPALPSESVVFGRSLPAESSLTAIIKNEETGATLETLMTALPPERVCNELSERLSRNGWRNISPDADNNAFPGYFQIYQRKDALCAIMVGHALRENKSCVTILFKEKNTGSII